MTDLQLTNFTLKFSFSVLNFNICTLTACFFHHSPTIHLFCTNTCSRRASIDFKRHCLKLVITKISKIWLNLSAIHPVVCKHLYTFPYILHICGCIHTSAHIQPLYTFVYTYMYICIALCVCVFTYAYKPKSIHKYAIHMQYKFTNMQYTQICTYLAIKIKGITH